MMGEILPYIISLASGCVLVVCTYKINKMLQKRDKAALAEANKQQAIAEGVKCLLRDAIVTAFNKYTDKGFCPIYAKENVTRAFKAYKALDGNGVVEELYEKLKKMPEEKHELEG